jgi:hypothetical protein
LWINTQFHKLVPNFAHSNYVSRKRKKSCTPICLCRSTSSKIFQNLYIQEGFWPRIVWCGDGGNHPKNNTAKFGSMLDMEVKKIRILLYSLVIYWNSS